MLEVEDARVARCHQRVSGGSAAGLHHGSMDEGECSMSPEVVTILGLLALFAIRIGVPILVIMGLSYVAYRWLGEDTEKTVQPARSTAAIAPRVSIGGPAPIAQVLYAGTHCWDAKGCSEAMKANCPAVAKSELPCWLAIQMKTGHLKENCFGCQFYERPAVDQRPVASA